jgi:hypothetical protein
VWSVAGSALGFGVEADGVPAELAKGVSLVLVLVAILVVALLGLAAVTVVLMMGGRLRRRVQDGLPPSDRAPDPMWPLQVPPADDADEGEGSE